MPHELPWRQRGSAVGPLSFWLGLAAVVALAVVIVLADWSPLLKLIILDLFLALCAWCLFAQYRHGRRGLVLVGAGLWLAFAVLGANLTNGGRWRRIPELSGRRGAPTREG